MDGGASTAFVLLLQLDIGVDDGGGSLVRLLLEENVVEVFRRTGVKEFCLGVG